ncbi:MAG: hypothetical protein RL417_2345 [Pseudomonadota bacterium]
MFIVVPVGFEIDDDKMFLFRAAFLSPPSRAAIVRPRRA